MTSGRCTPKQRKYSNCHATATKGASSPSKFGHSQNGAGDVICRRFLVTMVIVITECAVSMDETGDFFTNPGLTDWLRVRRNTPLTEE